MAKIAIVCGSTNDFRSNGDFHDLFKLLRDLDVKYERIVCSCHRNNETLATKLTGEELTQRGVAVVIACATAVANLPAILAGQLCGFSIPVIGVNLASESPANIAALLSSATIPRWAPVASTGIGMAGLFNAGIIAVQILANKDPELAHKLRDYVNHNRPEPEI